MRIVFLGPPGSGKGTQAQLLSKRLGIPSVSTGEMLRAAVRAGASVAQQAKAIMDRGELVPDEVMIGLIRDRLRASDTRQGFILDGFPRTVQQAEALERLIAESGNGEGLSAVINLSAPESVLVDRLHGRSAEEHRADDRPDAIRERLAVYHRKTEPLIGFYRQRHLLLDVDGMGDVEEIAERIDKALAAGNRATGAA